MASVIERIENELQTRKRSAEDALSKQQQRIRQSQESYLASEALREQQGQEEMQRRRLIAEPIFRQSGVLEQMREIESRYLMGFRRHVVIVNWFMPEATLAWGDTFRINEYGNLDYEKRRSVLEIFSRNVLGVKSYRYCGVQIDVNTKDLLFSHGDRLKGEEWQRDLSLVSDLLATSYINAIKVYENDYSPPPEPSPSGDTYA